MRNEPGAFNQVENLIGAILGKIEGINNPRKKFMEHIFMLFMGIRGRFNFLNMERYGKYSEQSYRNNFDKDFDFNRFNLELINRSCSTHLLIAFDPSFIPKSGKHTDHLGWFWSGTSGKALRGLEIGGLAVIDFENNTAMSLEAVQTPSAAELKLQGKSLVDHYAQIFIERKSVLESISKYITVDGYFAKDSFVNPILKNTSLHLICKLRKDANLYYPNTKEKTGKRGRPKLYTHKVDVQNIDKNAIILCYEDEETKVYEGVVYCKMLKRNIKIAYIESTKAEDAGKYAILFSTDTTIKGELIYLYYKSRFQIEFLFRDAKQHCGLNHCQARDEKKHYFHFNASLSAVSIAKAIYYLQIPKQERGSFSMGDIKTMYSNKLIVDRIIANLDFDHSKQKLDDLYRDVLCFGTIRAMAA